MPPWQSTIDDLDERFGLAHVCPKIGNWMMCSMENGMIDALFINNWIQMGRSQHITRSSRSANVCNIVAVAGQVDIAMEMRCGVCLIFDCAQHGFDQTEDVTGDVKVVSLLVTCTVGVYGKRSIHHCAGISCSQFSVWRKVEPRMQSKCQIFVPATCCCPLCLKRGTSNIA